jgi:hypothetical protein
MQDLCSGVTADLGDFMEKAAAKAAARSQGITVDHVHAVRTAIFGCIDDDGKVPQ